MAALNFSKSHSLGGDEASIRIRTLLDKLTADYPKLKIRITWSGDRRGTCTGRGFDGNFTVSDSNVRIDIKLGLVARRFRDRINDRMHQKLTEHFPS